MTVIQFPVTMQNDQTNPINFQLPRPRPLPVLLLLDTSGSMNRDDRIGALNKAVAEMIVAFKENETLDAEIVLGIITFGGGVSTALPMTRAAEVSPPVLTATGKTYMGGALREAKRLIEDRNGLPRPSYRPLVLLLSDGKPTDDYEQALSEFLADGSRSAKCDRMAIHFGGNDPDFGPERLERFVEGTGHRVFRPTDAKGLDACLRAVSMSMSIRSRSVNPNQTVPVPEPTDPEGGYF